MTELWCVHILGPDDVIAAPSREAADAKAAKLNEWLGRYQPVNDENMPKIRAFAEIWPHSETSHAAELPKWTD